MRLRLNILTLSTAVAVMAAAVEPAPARHFDGVDSRYVMVWSEDFNADSLDRRVWNVEVNGTGCGNNELEHYIDSPANVAVRDGNLVVTARRQDYGNHSFTSGRLNTHGKFTFTYGLVEARVKLPETADGLWPAVWFMGEDITDRGWPYCGEIDLLEMGHADGISSGAQTSLYNGALHYGADSQSHAQHVGVGRTPYSLQDGRYHSFYLLWTPESIKMYVDDIAEPYLEMATAATDDPTAPGHYFNKPQFMLVNLAVGGDFPGIHEASGVTALNESNGQEASMYIDYIRIYLPDNNLFTEK